MDKAARSANGSAGVTVVIPTCGRPELLARALGSVLAQTVRPQAIVIVADGVEEPPGVAGSLTPEVSVITLPERRGAAAARNAGAARAKTPWIAFLDDDDQWLPAKLEIQVERAAAATARFPIVATRFIARSSERDVVCPDRLPHVDEHLSEYLLAHDQTLRIGALAPSTVLTRTQLVREHPFSEDLPLHEDWEWLLRVSAVDGVEIDYLPDALAVCSLGFGRTSLSNASNWRYSLAWVHRVRHLVTRRAAAGFLLTEVPRLAAHQRDWRAFWPLLSSARRLGSPRYYDVVSYLGIWLLPRFLRRLVRRFWPT
jgi:glycosyltransferase involved in cell wall biosynthesis